ncbi:hypothetical protein [Methylorubrum extorquens]
MTSPPTASLVSAVEKPWRLYDVTVRWSDDEVYTETVSARTAASARYRRFLCVSDARPDLTFRQFLGMSKARLVSAARGEPAYGYLRRHYGVDVKYGDRVVIQRECDGINGRAGVVVHPNGSTHYVHVVLDGEDHISLFHPGSIIVLPASHAPVSSDTPNAEGEPASHPAPSEIEGGRP